MSLRNLIWKIEVLVCFWMNVSELFYKHSPMALYSTPSQSETGKRPAQADNSPVSKMSFCSVQKLDRKQEKVVSFITGEGVKLDAALATLLLDRYVKAICVKR